MIFNYNFPTNYLNRYDFYIIKRVLMYTFVIFYIILKTYAYILHILNKLFFIYLKN